MPVEVKTLIVREGKVDFEDRSTGPACSAEV